MPRGFRYDNQISLGQLIDALGRREDDQKVRFDFGYMHPTGLHSYRGFYEDLAIGHTDEGEAPTVKEFLTQLREAVGETFHGWKGGSYRMDHDSSLWVDQSSHASGTIVTGIAESSWQTVITTAFVDV